MRLIRIDATNLQGTRSKHNPAPRFLCDTEQGRQIAGQYITRLAGRGFAVEVTLHPERGPLFSEGEGA